MTLPPQLEMQLHQVGNSVVQRSAKQSKSAELDCNSQGILRSLEAVDPTLKANQLSGEMQPQFEEFLMLLEKRRGGRQGHSIHCRMRIGFILVTKRHIRTSAGEFRVYLMARHRWRAEPRCTGGISQSAGPTRHSPYLNIGQALSADDAHSAQPMPWQDSVKQSAPSMQSRLSGKAAERWNCRSEEFN